MKFIKYFHIILGVFLLLVYVVEPLYFFMYNNRIDIVARYVEPPQLVILLCALAHLFFGVGIKIQFGFRRFIQGVTSLCFTVGGVLCFYHILMGPIYLLDHTIVILVFIGTFFHLALSFKHRDVSYDTSEREYGTVKWFNNSKGFGFITRDDGSDIFVHYRSIRGNGHRSLVEGQRVVFYVVKKNRGLQAEDVTEVSNTP